MNIVKPSKRDEPMHPHVVVISLNPAIDKTVSVDCWVHGDLNRVKQTRIDIGGKGINVARMLHEFGVPVTIVGLCAGAEGAQLKRTLSELGIPCTFVEAEGHVRTNLKIFDESTRLTTELNEHSLRATPRSIDEFMQTYSNLLQHSSLIVLTGSIPPGAPNDWYAELIALAKQQNVKVILDADGRSLQAGISAVPFAVKPNRRELEALVGETLDTIPKLVQAAQQLQESGIAYVLLSLGGKGSLLVHNGEVFRAIPFPIQVQSTVGAGDGMVATLVYGLLQHMCPEQLTRWTSTAGTLTAAKEGTQLSTLQEIRNRLHDVTVTKELG